MQPSQPLLSICIPTFNRADLLEVCLASVLPQVTAQKSESGQAVECVVSDNASSDRTQQVLAQYAQRYDFRISRNATNIGIIGNITKVVSEIATGEFAWLIGDDDVLTTGAVDRLVKTLCKAQTVDLIALNVGFFPESQRPDACQALNGVSSKSPRTLRKSLTDGVFTFEQLLEGPCADFTAMYSFVMRRSLWLQHYPKASNVEPFTSLESTYPHAAIIAQHMPGKLGALIAEPAVVIYELPKEKYSWAKHVALVVLIYFTELLQRYEANGVSPAVLAPYYRYQLQHRSGELGDLMFNRKSAGEWRHALKFAWMLRGYPILLLRSFLIALTHPLAPKVFAIPLRAILNRRTRSRATTE